MSDETALVCTILIVGIVIGYFIGAITVYLLVSV